MLCDISSLGGREDDFLLTAYIAAFLSGILGAMGFGGGSVLIIYLTLFAGVDQLSAQGTNLIFFIPCAILSVVINLKNHLVKYRQGVWLILGGFVGIAVGSFLVGIIKTEVLSKMFGAFVFIIGLITLFQKPKAKNKSQNG